MTRPTLRDVARAAGLSVTQTSRALNGHDDVATATKQRVRAVADEIGYVPNLSARRLQDPRALTATIGVILPSDSVRFSDPFFGDLLTAMTIEAGAHGLRLTLSTPPPDTTPIDAYERAIRSHYIDGFVLLRTATTDERVQFLIERDFPFVTFGRPDVAGHDFGSVDQPADCMAPVVDHLITHGHRSIACLAEPAQFQIASTRLDSFRAAMAANGLSPDGDVVQAGFRQEDGFRAATTLLSRPNPPSAIVAVNDLLALGAIDAAQALGLSVPDDVSVVGFDDIALAAQIRPPLTTQRFPADEIGALLVRELLPAIEAGRPTPADRSVTPSLVVRHSSGPAPS